MGRFFIGLVVAALLATVAGGVLAEPLKCSAPAADRGSLKSICEVEWNAAVATVDQKEQAARRKQVEWTICNGFIEKQYPACADSLIALRRGLNSQKHVAEGRHAKGWLSMEVVQLFGIFFAAVATVAAAFSDKHWTIRLANVAAGAIVTALATILALYDSASVYASELKAQSEISELESRIGDALLAGRLWTRADKDGDAVAEEITDRTINQWQSQLSDILRRDIGSYVDGSKNRIVKLTK